MLDPPIRGKQLIIVRPPRYVVAVHPKKKTCDIYNCIPLARAYRKITVVKRAKVIRLIFSRFFEAFLVV